jgi:phage baseplate assembly protein gpV
MANDSLQFGLLDEEKQDDRVYGVAPATVIDNIDLLGEARVQLMLPWAPGFMPWARIATTMAGLERGTYFIPQIGDEVLVAFNQGDIREPYVIGALWNTLDRPPSLLPTDPINKRMIRTPLGQGIIFDDLLQTVTINNTDFQTLILGPAFAMLVAGGAPPPALSPGTASVKVDPLGNITITGTTSITLTAPTIALNGTNITINGATSTTVNGGAQCTIMGASISIG